MAGKETSVQAEYMHGRGFRDSARLHLQHWIWKECLGYVLHPAIATTAPDWKVADLGTGNACWLLDVARKLPSGWSLHGFDISPLQFPASQHLPKNVSLQVLDVFDDIPHELVATFDVVHVRAFAVVVKGGKTGHLMANLKKLLKPGGYLQWDEFDVSTFAAHSPATDISKEYTDEIIEVWYRFARKLDLPISWTAAVGESFPEHGFTVVDDSRFGPNDFLRKAATDNWMMALEEVGFNIMGQKGEAAAQISPEEYAALLDKAEAETRKGVSIWIDMLVVLGRK